MVAYINENIKQIDALDGIAETREEWNEQSIKHIRTSMRMEKFAM
tara:strand:+ start:173 stop:307 length:135 start_codon:yes stop_codon:yes gene_type:complete